jgi:hypothetical protein
MHGGNVMAKDGRMSLANRQWWAMEQFGEAELGDARRTKRLVKLATQMAAHSDGSIPQQTGTIADMKATYRLFAEEDVTHDAICGPHIESTRGAASQLPLVFLIQDTCELNFTPHVACRGLGPIGHGGQLRGLHQQNVLAVAPTMRQPLGLMYQCHHRRQSRNEEQPFGAASAGLVATGVVLVGPGHSKHWLAALGRALGPCGGPGRGHFRGVR